jgi:hypothetical protein
VESPVSLKSRGDTSQVAKVVKASLNRGSVYIEYPFGFNSEMLLDFS